jgi:glycosyltransferase involved in cell wall biosynthesis
MKILFLSQIVPYPPHGGVLQRGYNIVREIAKENDVHLLAFVHPEILTDEAMIEESKAVLEEMCATVDYFSLWPKRSKLHNFGALLAGAVYPGSFGELAHRSAAYKGRMVEILTEHDIDIVHYDTIGLARYKSFAPSHPSVLTHHNIESNLMARRAKVERMLLGRRYVARQARVLREMERTESPKFDVNVMMSSTDEADLREICGDVNTVVVPNGVDVDYFQPNDSEPEPAIIYTGGMNMFANEDAVLHLLRDMWGDIKAAVPGVKFYVIGQDPTREILELAKADSSIVVTGFVDDIRPYVARASVYVVPIRVGGGTRLKVLDALAQGKAIVSTSVGCEGIEVADGKDIRIEDSVTGFVAATVELLVNRDARRELGVAARNLAETRYSWEGIGAVLNQVYRDVASANG